MQLQTGLVTARIRVTFHKTDMSAVSNVSIELPIRSALSPEPRINHGANVEFNGGLTFTVFKLVVKKLRLCGRPPADGGPVPRNH